MSDRDDPEELPVEETPDRVINVDDEPDYGSDIRTGVDDWDIDITQSEGPDLEAGDDLDTGGGFRHNPR